jgi:hypothetical protein
MSLFSLLPPELFCSAVVLRLCPFGSGSGPTICPEATIGNPVGDPPGVLDVSGSRRNCTSTKPAHRDQTRKNDDRHEILSFGALVGLSPHYIDHHSETTVKKS